MDDLLARSAAELFARQAGSDGLVEAVEEAGFLLALVPEASGGIGIGPAEALPVLLAAARFAVTAPLGDTMVARALLAGAGIEAPPGLVALAEPWGDRMGRLPSGPLPDWVLWPDGGGAVLLPLPEEASAAEEGASGGLVLRRPSGEGPRLGGSGLDVAGAWLEVAAMAGAAERILEDTLRHAQDRQQFGRPVAAFQAVQQQLSVLTEDVFATRMAAQLASVADGEGPLGLSATRVAAAKLRAGEAAVRIASIAHAVQGAMGITEEVALHRQTARLQAGRLRFGGEAHWALWLGRRVLADAAPDTLGFVRAHLAPVSLETTS
ncbi:acyl-CoA dehydrogenase family protein [Pseudoroseomonas globiformis]|uniref:Acyl-CoA dehydrogenase family protein n=1 Tax=Teichococcus globiformis TaxID=2307229 RepID=A0ABV7FVK8_9PROT